MPTPLPYVLGSEAVGIITEKGDNLEDSPFQPGTKVLAILPSGGGYSEFINADPQYCVPLPPSIASFWRQQQKNQVPAIQCL